MQRARKKREGNERVKNEWKVESAERNEVGSAEGMKEMRRRSRE